MLPPKGAKLKKILLICGGIIAAIVIITLIVVFTLPKDEEPPTDSKTLTLEDILYNKLSARRFNGSWVSDTEILYRDLEGNVILFNAVTGNRTTILSTENEELAQGVKFDLSADKKYLLVAREHQKIFRHSFAALYDIIEIDSATRHRITINGEQYPLLLVQWAPVGSSLVFVYANNIYYKSSPSETEQQLTFDSLPSVYNGITDWVYEEEVFSSSTALWFSPNGEELAYIRFDDTQTRIMNLPVYGPPGLLEFQYTKDLIIHYPKAGSVNPTVTLMRATLPLTPIIPAVLKAIQPPSALLGDHIITAVTWSDNINLFSVWMNRVQNKAYIQRCNKLDVCNVVKELQSLTGWVELFEPPMFNKAGTDMAIIDSQLQTTTAGAYRHVTIINSESGVSFALTKGLFVVQEILRWDSVANIIYYTANTETSSQSLHVYAIKAVQDSTPVCLTCTMEKYTYFSAEISSSGQYIVLSSLGPNVPRVDLYEIKVNPTSNNPELTHINDWEINQHINDVINKLVLPNIIYDEIEINTEFTAKVMMTVPKNLDDSGNTKYPMLVDVYGGPDSYSVVNKWQLDWGSYLAANHSIIYTRIDGRGSGLRGDKLLHTLYRHLGTVEITDQIEIVKKLKAKYSYIDGNSTGIWGWSYGGYASAMALAKDTENVFRCAASIAPVTDWTFYDSIYTERYMGLPTDSDNKLGYDESRLSTLAKQFDKKKYLLVHGTLDDNVHFQQSMSLAWSLEKSDILFKEISYPDEDHGLAGVRPHLYHSLGRFFGDCLNLKKDL